MQLVTAKTIKAELDTFKQCEGIDGWIYDVVRPSFIKSNGDRILINTKAVKWQQTNFIAAMTLRGFDVVWECEDRPCSSPYYAIKLT